METMKQVIFALQEIEKDSTTPRNVKAKVSCTLKTLSDASETSIKVSKALHELEELADDTNMQPYIRTQIFNIVSLLEVV